MVEGQDWDYSDYFLKFIGGQYFFVGVEVVGFDFQYDYLFLCDGDGYGLYIVSMVVGNFKVKVEVEGVDFGMIFGVVFGVKIVVYKVCYVGFDVIVIDDDICVLSDFVFVIDQVVVDGVDVINYLIGGGVVSIVLVLEDIVFFNVVVVGVFVVISVGNDGFDLVIVDYVLFWYMMVVVLIILIWEGIVQFDGFEQVGVLVSVLFGESVIGLLIYVGDVVVVGVVVMDVQFCLFGIFDFVKVFGYIVVCDCGGNVCVEKLQVVKDVGGIGMVFVNVFGGVDLFDNDFYVVFIVYLNVVYCVVVFVYVQGGVDCFIIFVGENIMGVIILMLQIVGFLSCGLMLVDGSDVMKLDVVVFGVVIFVVIENVLGEELIFGILFGMLMVLFYVVGLGVLYFGEYLKVMLVEIKLVLMMIVYDIVFVDGLKNMDLFEQGVGQVDLKWYLNFGLLYFNGVKDWVVFLDGKGLLDFFGIDLIDGSDLNQVLILIGFLISVQIVICMVILIEKGMFMVKVLVFGVNVKVMLQQLKFDCVGQMKIFMVMFDNVSVLVEQWVIGMFIWMSVKNLVCLLIVLFLVMVDVLVEVSGSGVDGSIEVDIIFGFIGDFVFGFLGLMLFQLFIDLDNLVEGYFGDENLGDVNKDVVWIVDVLEGMMFFWFDFDLFDDKGSDFDFIVYWVVSLDDLQYYQCWCLVIGLVDEQVIILVLILGMYFVVVNIYLMMGLMMWDMIYVNVFFDGEGDFIVMLNLIVVVCGQQILYEFSWIGLIVGV